MLKGFFALGLLFLFLIGLTHSSALTLSTSGKSFTVDGKKTFLYGVSYFNTKEYNTTDLLWLKDHGFNLIRIWLDWNRAGESMFNQDGSWKQDCPSRYKGVTRGCDTHLVDLIDFADGIGMVVDVTILHVTSQVSSRGAIESTAKLLRHKQNVLIDTVNEHNVRDRFSHADGKRFVEWYSALADHPITMSSAGNHIFEDNNLNEELGMGITMLTPHFDRRGYDFYDKVYERSRRLLSKISVPLYLQEEDRNGWNGAEYTVDQLVKAAKEAKRAGAAGYIFHSDAKFYADRNTCFKDSLDRIELQAINRLKGEL